LALFAVAKEYKHERKGIIIYIIFFGKLNPKYAFLLQDPLVLLPIELHTNWKTFFGDQNDFKQDPPLLWAHRLCLKIWEQTADPTLVADEKVLLLDESIGGEATHC